jgi:CubicO group peptidase (beta-lactamase class C family)
MTDVLTGRRPKTAREMGIMQGFPPPPEKRPSLANWDLAPFNRWSFLNTRKLFPTVAVAHDSATARALPQNLQELGDLSFSDATGDAMTINAWLDHSYTDGFVVLHKGAVVFERYANDMTAASAHLGQSVSKSLVGALAGVLQATGAITRDALVTDYVPELSGSGYGGATLGDVLDMRSGVRFTEDYGLVGSDMTWIDIASGWRPIPKGTRRPSIRDVMADLPKVRDHASPFSYRSIETDAIAWVLERATGQNLAQLCADYIWQPMGAEHDGFFTIDAEGTALADGGFNATLRDYARLGDLIRSNGKAGSRQVLPESWVDNLFTQAEPSQFGTPYTDLAPNGAYRDFWWIHDPQARIAMARGVFGQMIYVDQGRETVVAKLSTWPDYLIPEFSAQAFAASAAIAAHLATAVD